MSFIFEVAIGVALGVTFCFLNYKGLQFAVMDESESRRATMSQGLGAGFIILEILGAAIFAYLVFS